MTNTQEDIAALWKEALAGYERDAKHALSPETLKSFEKIQQPDDLLTQIESQDQKFHGWRHKHEKLWSTLRSLVAPISTLLRIAKGPAELADFGIVTTGVIGALFHLVKV